MNHLINELLIQEIIDELNIPDFNDFIKSRCKHHLANIQFNTELKPRYNKGYISDNLFKNKKNRCTACVYNDGHIRQCSNTIKSNNMCNKHNNIKNKYGYLIFGDINNDYRKNIRYNYDKCCAITFKNGIIEQCCKNKQCNDLCKYHNTYKTKYGNLKYGSLI